MHPSVLSAYIKGTTSLRLFLFLSLGIVMSSYIPQYPSYLPYVVLPSILIIAIVLHYTHCYRLSVVSSYLLLVAYGLFLSDSSLFEDRLSVVNSQLSIIKESLVALFPKRGIHDDSLLAALTFGDKSALSSTMVSDFRTAGVAHVLVVSGMHVGFIYLLIDLLIRRLQYKRITAILGVFLLWTYAALVGFALSVCRAVFMFTLMLLMRMVGESYRSFHALFLAAFLQLLISPSALFDIGFQLSYIAVLSILIFYPFFSFPHNKLSIIVKPICITVSAQILVAPLVAYYFGQFPLYFILTNLALSFLVPVIFIGGFLTLIPGLGSLIAYPINLLLDLLSLIVSAVASFPMALVQVRLSLFALILIYILIALVLLYAISDR